MLPSERKVKGVVLLSVAVVLVFLSLRPPVNPSTSASPPDSGPLVDPSPSVSAPTPTRAPALADMPMPTAAPMATPTPSPVPNNYIWIPWRSQFDGTAYASSNCGPAALGMAMSYYGEWWSSDGIRRSTNAWSGITGVDEGTDWASLKYAAEARDFKVAGLYDDAGAYRKWTIDDLVKEVEQGHPVILLVRYRSLPGNANADFGGDHYIVFLGLMADGRVVYHDSAYDEEIEGAYRIMSQEVLLEAWGNTSVGQQFTAMSLVWEDEGRMWDGSR